MIMKLTTKHIDNMIWQGMLWKILLHPLNTTELNNYLTCRAFG